LLWPGISKFVSVRSTPMTCRLLIVVSLIFCSFSARLSAQESVNVAQHQVLPLIGDKITFLPYNSTTENVARIRIFYTPGTCYDVRLVNWSPPLATVSFRSGAGVLYTTTRIIHAFSFPPEIRAKLNQLAPMAAAAKIKDYENTLILKDGRRLENVTILYAYPYAIHVSHSSGEEDLRRSIIDPNFKGSQDLTSDSVYYKQLPLKDGTILEHAHIIAQSPETVRVSHSGGIMSLKMQDIPPEAAKLVQEYLISRGKMNDEVLNASARSEKNLPRATPFPPQPKPAPTAKPELIRKGPFQYAQLPLNNGKVLHDVTITGFDWTSIQVEGDVTQTKFSSSEFPSEVLDDIGGSRYKILSEFLSDGLVAHERSPVFEAILKPGEEWRYHNATGGKTIGYVGTGFVVKSNRYRNFDGAVAGFSKTFGGFEEAYVLVPDFAHLGKPKDKKWWNENDANPLPDLSGKTPLVFKFYALDANTVLLDPFEGKYTLFGNERKVMKHAWRIVAGDSDRYAFVETDHGYYFGILSQKGDLAEAKMTWPQLLSHQSMPFVISKENQKPIKAGQPIIKITDYDGSQQSALSSFKPEQRQIEPSQYRRLSEQGLPGVLVLQQSPEDDGVDFVGSDREPATYSVQKEEIINRIVLEYVSETNDVLTTKFIKQQRERTVERERVDGRTNVKEGPWQEVKKEIYLELPKDADGGVRLTDGEKIYEIQPSRIGDSQLVVYKVAANVLNKQKH
jgi:hypothetical protein